MKKTQRKDAFRNITRQLVSYLSIIVIAALGVSAFLGIGYSSKALCKNADAFYDEVNYRDLEVISTLLLSPEDIEVLTDIDGVADIEPVWQISGKAYIGEQQHRVSIVTLTERINRPVLVEGRLPEEPFECAIEQKLADKMGWRAGDTFEFLEMLEAAGEYFLASDEYVITGIVNHPDHTNLSLDEIPFLMVTKDSFDIDGMAGSCMKAELIIDKDADTERFGSEYEKAVSAVSDRITALIPERTAFRDAEIRTRMLERLDILSAELEKMKADNPGDASLYDFADNYLAESRREIEETPPCRWIVNDCRGNASFVQVITGSGNLSGLEMTFSLLFILIGALVIYATVSKMADEQRTQIGTMKALGFFRREIFRKYLLFGLSATLAGMLAGVLIARYFLESFVLNGYNAYYTYDVSRGLIVPGTTLIVLTAGVLISSGAVWTACRRLLREPAVRLLQPQAPAGKGKTGRDRRFLSLYSRLILSNIRTDIRRVAVTAVSVAGCCALIVIGFTLKHGVDGSIRNQYPAVSDYDAKISFYLPVNQEEAAEVLQRLGVEYLPLQDCFCTYRITDLRTAELFCGDIDAIGSFYHLNDWQTGEKLGAAEDGVLIPRRLAEIYGLRIGSEIEIALRGVNSATVRVAGIYENYIGSPIVMGPSCYALVFGEDCEYDTLFVRYNGQDENEVLRLLKEDPLDYEEVVPADAGKSVFESATSVVNAIIVLFIFMAAVMAGVVLLNLTNICIMQKKRELTIMRINGFTVGEVIGYVIRETAVTTIAGIVLGIAAGTLIAYRIIRSMEQPFIQFERGVSVTAWIIGTAVTVLFTVIVNMIALRRVKHLKLTDLFS